MYNLLYIKRVALITLLLVIKPLSSYAETNDAPLPEFVDAAAKPSTTSATSLKARKPLAKKSTANTLPYIQRFSAEIEMFAGETRVIQ